MSGHLPSGSAPSTRTRRRWHKQGTNCSVFYTLGVRSRQNSLKSHFCFWTYKGRRAREIVEASHITKSAMSSLAGLRAGIQQMRAQMRAQSAVFKQTLRQHSNKAAAATGGGGILAFAQS